MDSLEETLEPLRQLPARMTSLETRIGGLESQVLQLRTEMRGEFAAIHSEISTLATKDDLKTLATKDDLKTLATKDDLKTLATKDDLKTLSTKDELKLLATRDDLKAYATKADLEPLATRAQMLMLHEDLVERIALLAEGRAKPRPRAGKKRSR
jgi:hypothetical protein